MADLAQILMQQQSQGKIDRQAELAKMLLQNGQQVTNPLVAALSGFVGTHELGRLADKQGQLDAAKLGFQLEQQQQQQDIEQQRFDRQMGLQEQRMQQQQQQFSQQMQQNAQQFAANLSLQREKFNAEAIRDAQKNAITKVTDPKTGNDLLFKGAKPMTDGLEKGFQWAADKDGNMVAAPIPTQPSEKASQVKDLVKETAKRLLGNKYGLGAQFGVYDRYTPNLTDAAMDAETDLNQLRSLLTAENLDLMTGVLSESDLKVIANVAGGGIAETATTEGATEAIKRIYESVGGDVSELGGGEKNVSNINTKTGFSIRRID